MMHSLFKYRPIYIGTLALAALIATVYIATRTQNPIETSSAVFDEVISTADGSKVRLVHADAPEKGVILFVDDGTDTGITTDYAKKIAALSYYVVVLDAKELLTLTSDGPSPCLNVAERLLDIQDGLRQQLDLDPDYLPILVGNNEGAALVYSALAQTETHSFHAAISINFTGQLHNATNLCFAEKFMASELAGVANLAPIERLSSTWYLFQEVNKTQSLKIHEFIDQIVNAKLTMQGDKNTPVISDVTQILNWLDPRLADQLSSNDKEGDLPLIEVVSKIDKPSQTLAIMLTGDGGWAEIDKGIARTLADRGIPTVAVDSLSYFWKKKTPDEAAIDIESIMTEYLAKWHKKHVVLIGYSFGADVLPFIANRFIAKNKNSIALIVLLGIGKTATFEFRLSSWIDADTSARRLPLLPEITKMSWAKSICIYGVSDTEANCSSLNALGVKVISMSGDHHFDEKYRELAQHIIDNIRVD